jgi:hypothetical protein
VTDPLDLPIESEKTQPTEAIHSKDYPCSTCGLSLASRFRNHISPKLNLLDALWVKISIENSIMYFYILSHRFYLKIVNIFLSLVLLN